MLAEAVDRSGVRPLAATGLITEVSLALGLMAGMVRPAPLAAKPAAPGLSPGIAPHSGLALSSVTAAAVSAHKPSTGALRRDSRLHLS